MAIILNCPGCNGRLGVLETAAGSKIKCPKCERMVPVPAPDDHLFENEFEVVEEDDFEVVDDDEPKKTPKRAVEEDDDRPRKTKAAAKAAWDDDEDDDDDRPRKKSFKKKQSSNNMLPLILGGALAGLLLLGGVGYLLFSGGSGSTKSGSAATSSWVKFEASDGSFNVMMPAVAATTDDMAVADMLGLDREEVRKAREITTAQGVTLDSWFVAEGSRSYIVSMLRFPQAPPVSMKNQVISTIEKANRDRYQKIGTILGEDTLTVAGQSVKFLRVKTNAGKYFISGFLLIGDRAYDLSVLDTSEVTLTEEKVIKFLNSFNHTRQGATPGPASSGRRPSRGR